MNKKINEILRVPFDFCSPTVKVDFEYMECTDVKEEINKILLLHVHQSTTVHANQADEVYYRLGDKSKKLTFDERMQLMYDKGDMLYENTFIKNVNLNEIDLDLVEKYSKLLGSSKMPYEFLFDSLGLVNENNNIKNFKVAAVLLFGKNPQSYFHCARIRFLKYEGTEEKTGAQMNIIKDIMFEGAIIEVLQKTLDFVQTQIKEYTRLHKDARFHTIPEYPQFVWKEAIVNAVAHRDYHILGTDIQIKMFDDRFVVESPGTLPGLVRINNIRNMHFSRNPVIARYLRDYKFVRELGEGVDRMYQEMFEAGLPAPEYKVKDFMTVLTISKINKQNIAKITESLDRDLDKDLERDLDKYKNLDLNDTQNRIVEIIIKNSKTTQKQLAKVIGINERNIRNNIEILKNKRIILRIGFDKSGHWNVIK